MALNSAYFQPFSFSDPTSPSYDPSTDEDLDWMQYAGRNAYAAKGGGRPQGAKPLPTSGSAQQKTQTALVPQPTFVTQPATSQAVVPDYLNPQGPGYDDGNPILRQVREEYLGEQQPNPGGGAVTSRVVGNGGNQDEYLAALTALPEWQAANAATAEIARRRAAGQAPRESDARLVLQASEMRALAGQRLQAEKPGLFRQRQPDTLAGPKGEYMIGEDGRLRPNPYYRPEAKPVPQSDLVPTGRGTYAIPTVNVYGDPGLNELSGMTGSMSPEQKAAADLEAERRKIALTGDQNARVANIQGANALGVEGLRGKTAVQVATITGGSRVEAAGKRGGGSKLAELEKLYDMERKNRDSLQKQHAQMMKSVESDNANIAMLESKPGSDPAMIARLKRARDLKLASNDAWATTNSNYLKSMENMVSISEQMAQLRDATQSGDGLPSPGTSGDRTDKPVPKPSQIKPPPADASSKISTTQAPDTNGGAKPRNRVLKGAKDKQGRTGTLTLAPDGVTVISFVPDGPVDGA